MKELSGPLSEIVAEHLIDEGIGYDVAKAISAQLTKALKKTKISLSLG